MTSTSVSVARRYFDALGAQDLDAALACWRPGAVDRLVGQQELVAPDGIGKYFSELFEAFPDFTLEVIDEVGGGDKTAVRWRASGTFAGPGTFQGFAPNGRKIAIEGCDVVTASGDGDLIERNDAYIDTGDLARQLGMLPTAGSAAEARLTKVANLRTRVQNWMHGTGPEPIADGVWVVRGGFPAKTMNVYFIADDGGVTVFDCFYTLDPQTGIKGAARVPHPAFNIDTEQARASVRKLASMSPSVAWSGYADPVRGDVVAQLEHAASAS